MDFNSNDEYLKAFPPNFGSKLESLYKLDQPSNLQAHGLPPKNPQVMENVEATSVEMPEPVCLDEDLECVEVQEPIQVNLANVENKEDELLKKEHEVFILCKEYLEPTEDSLHLTQPEIDEPMPQMVDMALALEVQRDDEMVLGEPRIETMLSLQDIEAIILDTKAFGNIKVDGPPSAAESMQKKTKDCEISTEDYISTNALKDPTLALDNSNHYKTEESILAEAATEATIMKDEIFGPATLKDFVESTQVFTEYERSITDIKTLEGNAMDIEASLCGQPTIKIEVAENMVITTDTIGQTEIVEKTLKTLPETSVNVDAVGQIEIGEPVTSEVIKKTTIRAISETQTSQTKLREHTQIDAEVFRIDNPTMALEIIEKTTIKAKTIYQSEEEEPPFEMNVVESANTSMITRLDQDLGTCSDANIDKIVDSIMNDIAGIEANIEADNEKADLEVGLENNTLQKKIPIYKKSIGNKSEAMCQDHVQSLGGQP